MAKKFSLSQEHFNKGVNDALTLSPLRMAFKNARKALGDAMENMPTMYEMNNEFIRKIRQLGRLK